MANCTQCGSSNIGFNPTRLVLVDGEWFCENCLKKVKGRVKCSRCGNEPFSSGKHFKTIDGAYICTDCMEKSGIMKEYEYIMQSVSKTRVSPPAASTSGTENLGALRILLDQNLSPGETVTLTVVGNPGEAIACSQKNLYVLKSGLATGSLTDRKCTKFSLSEIKDIDLKLGSLYGVLEVVNGRFPPCDPNNVAKAKKSENAITFLVSKKGEIEQARNAIKALLRA